MAEARSAPIDALRALAVVLVIGRHMELPPPDSIMRGLAEVWQRGGWVGVDLFFVLSGYLVSGLLFKEQLQHGTISAPRFLIRRGFRIYPPFYALILITVVINAVLYSPPPRAQILREIFFIQNYAPGLWNHTWSLAIEEHFYFLTPVLLLLLMRRRSADARNPFSPIPGLFLVLAAALILARTWLSLTRPYDHYTQLFPTHLRIDALFFGVTLAYYDHYHSAQLTAFARAHRRPLLIGGTLALSLAFIYPLENPFIPSVGLTLFYLAAGSILLGFLAQPARTGAPLPQLAAVGRASYSVYLWHMPMGVWGIAFLKSVAPFWNWYVYFLCYLVGAICLGLAMNRLFEAPANRIRDRYFPSRSGSPLVTS